MTLMRYRPTPWWWSVKIEICRRPLNIFMYFNIEINILHKDSFECEKVHMLVFINYRYWNVEKLHFILIQIINFLASSDRQERNRSNIFNQKHYQVQDTGTCAADELLLHLTRTTPASQHLTYLLTYSMRQSPSWEANWFCS